MKQSATASACGKLMILGEHAVVYGYSCIVSSVDRFITVTAKKAKGKDAFITPGVSDQSLIRNAVLIFRKRFLVKEGVVLSTKSNLGNFGLGTSSATAVAAILALAKILDIKIDNHELFDLSYQTVKSVQKKASGFDVATSIHQGTILFHGKDKSVERLSIAPLPLVVAFSGFKADTPLMVERVVHLMKKEPEKVKNIFHSISQIVREGKKAIIKKNWRKLGELMNENHQLLIKLGVSSNKLNQMVEAAQKAGAFGVKLSGAGGGDCIIALVPLSGEKQVKEAIKRVGGKVLNLTVGKEKRENITGPTK